MRNRFALLAIGMALLGGCGAARVVAPAQGAVHAQAAGSSFPQDDAETVVAGDTVTSRLSIYCS